MVKSRLEVGDISVGFINELPISQNLSVSDVREPGTVKSKFTKSITIPGEVEIKRLFQNIFQIDSQLTTFNPNLKTSAKYYVNEVIVFDGDLQLLRINNKYVNDLSSTEFECSLVGGSANLFTDIAGLYLTDIDFSDLDHTFTYNASMFTPSVIGEGYAYAYQDFGAQFFATPLTDTWYFRYLKPLIFEREYVRRIFEDAGYSWESGGYFDTDYAKHIIIPDTKQGALRLSDTDRAARECFIGLTSTYSNSPQAGTLSVVSWYYYAVGAYINFVIPYDDDTTPYSDPGSIFDELVNWEVTIPYDADYTIYGSVDLDLVLVTSPAGSVTWGSYSANEEYSVNIVVDRSTNGGSTWTTVGLVNHKFNVPVQNIANTTVNTKCSIEIQNSYVATGTLYRIGLQQGAERVLAFYDGASSIINSGTSSIRFDLKQGSEFRAKLTNPYLEEGNTVEMQLTIPEDITQLDFLTSIIKSENLYIEPSQSYKDTYVIETREEFINTDASGSVDWTDKWAIDRGEEISPMGELDFNRLRLTYKSDKDYYNKLYEDKYKEVYGTELIDIDNDFIRNEKKIEPVFSATPIVGSLVNDIVAPRYFNLDKTTNICSPLKCNIRRLYWGGLINCQEHTFIYGSTVTYRNTYPFVGHVDNPNNPTIDLSFDNPYDLYYSFPQTYFTTNNRYNERYSKYIAEITDPNSKLVTRWMYLNETDINSFSFSRLVFIRDTYFFVNKIIDFNPQVKGLTKVELLKLKAGAVFVPSQVNIDNLGGDTGSSTDRRNSQVGSGIILGSDNFNSGFGSFIVGNNNVIG